MGGFDRGDRLVHAEIIAHILKSALEIGFVTSVAIAITTVIAGNAVLVSLFPVAA